VCAAGTQRAPHTPLSAAIVLPTMVESSKVESVNRNLAWSRVPNFTSTSSEQNCVGEEIKLTHERSNKTVMEAEGEQPV